MELNEFIENFVEHNSLVRLVYKSENGYESVSKSWDDVSMEWEILKGVKNKQYHNYKVIGVKDILVNGPYSEAVNIVIEKKSKSQLRKEKISSISRMFDKCSNI